MVLTEHFISAVKGVFIMRTIVSWHLDATESTNREDFLKVFYTWFTENHHFNLPANFYKLEKEQERNFSVDDDMASIICTSVGDDIYTSVFYSRHNAITNCSWVVEFVYVEKKSGVPGYIVANLRKEELSKNAEFKYQEHFEIKTPSVVKTLLDCGLATMEGGPLMKFPTLYINRKLARQEEINILEKYSTICHLTLVDTEDNWTFKISYPRLSYEVEYYGEGYEFERPENSILRRRYLPKSLDMEHLAPVVDNLFSMVNEGMSNYSHIDKRYVLGVFEANKSKTKVRITHALANAVREKRKLNGLSQGELAKYASSEEYPITPLLISRIEQFDEEKKLLSRIEISKLHAIEFALGLKEDYLVNIAQGNSEIKEKKASSFPKFCSNCGHKIVLPADDE